jgi:RNA polymerase sigma-70 factor (ECF subfamily)
LDPTTPDELLMVRAAQGDTSAFESLVLRHQSSVLSLIYRFTGDRVRAEDLAQEAFLRVWKAAKSYEPQAKFTTWMYRLVANLCLNEVKSPWRKRILSLHWLGSAVSQPEEEDGGNEIPDNAPSPEDVLLARERSRRVAAALGSVPKNQRLALILKCYYGLSYEEIAKVLDCSVSAVDSLLVRGKKNLQKKLGHRKN